MLVATIRALLRRRADQEELLRANEAMEAQVAERTRALMERMAALEVALAERKDLARRFVDAQEQERGRVSRELHDQTGQLLTAISLEMRVLRQMLQSQFPQEEESASPAAGLLARLDRLENAVGAQCVNVTIFNKTRHSREVSREVSREGNGAALSGDRVQVTIEDDGGGFDPTEVLQRGGLGLIGMHERAVLAGGTLTIESASGIGTVLYLRLPVTI